MQTITSTEAGERTQHTPGPWKLNDGEMDAKGQQATFDVFAGKQFITYTEGTRNPEMLRAGNLSFEQAEANAHLIAAAPELLDNLAEMIVVAAPLIQELYGKFGKAPQYERGERALRNAREILAKAEGRD